MYTVVKHENAIRSVSSIVILWSIPYLTCSMNLIDYENSYCCPTQCMPILSMSNHITPGQIQEGRRHTHHPHVSLLFDTCTPGYLMARTVVCMPPTLPLRFIDVASSLLSILRIHQSFVYEKVLQEIELLGIFQACNTPEIDRRVAFSRVSGLGGWEYQVTDQHRAPRRSWSRTDQVPVTSARKELVYTGHIQLAGSVCCCNSVD